MMLVCGFVALFMVVVIPLIATQTGRHGLLGCERLRLVALNAFAATNPDYILDSGVGDDAQDCDSNYRDVLSVHIGPRMAMADPPYWSDEISERSRSAVQVPSVQPWRMTNILAAMDEDEPTRLFGDTRAFIEKARGDSVLRHSAVQVVIYLDKAVSESAMRKIWPDPGVIFLSGPLAGKPLSWEPTSFCRYRGFDTCHLSGNAEPLVTEFRRWVSLLEPKDSPVLEQFGLNIADLRSRASEGLVYGFTAKNIPDSISKLVADPRVRAAFVVDVRPPE
ncbi:hypothetical protein [Sphaerisporangium album]|uniref:hypothetical protein n=1 Tax=Sphaerisporangium album TaxID=509200 RepID=UPI0011C04AB0|nr:hypothetical protein [Sphaerisporangium album]